MEPPNEIEIEKINPPPIIKKRKKSPPKPGEKKQADVLEPAIAVCGTKADEKEVINDILLEGSESTENINILKERNETVGAPNESIEKNIIENGITGEYITDNNGIKHETNGKESIESVTTEKSTEKDSTASSTITTEETVNERKIIETNDREITEKEKTHIMTTEKDGTEKNRTENRIVETEITDSWTIETERTECQLTNRQSIENGESKIVTTEKESTDERISKNGAPESPEKEKTENETTNSEDADKQRTDNESTDINDTKTSVHSEKTKRGKTIMFDDDVATNIIPETILGDEEPNTDDDASFKQNNAETQRKSILRKRTVDNRDTEKIPKEPWDVADIDSDDSEEKIPSPWTNYFRIYLHRFFAILFLVVSLTSSTLHSISFAMVCYLSNPATINGNAELECENNKFTADKYLLSRISTSLMWAILFPDIVCFVNSIYFVLFKKVDFPKMIQLATIILLETFYAIGRGALVFFIAPYFSKSLNVSLSWFITLLPILLNLTSKEHKLMSFCTGKLGKKIPHIVKQAWTSVKKFLILCIWGVGIVCFCFFPPVLHLFRLDDRQSQAGSETLIVFGFVGTMIIISFIQLVNYSMSSQVLRVQKWSEVLRGMDETHKLYAMNGSPQGTDFSVIACYSIASVMRILITLVIYAIYCNVHNISFGLHNDCQDRRLQSNIFSMARNSDGSYSDAGLMDLWVWIFVLSSACASYVGKTAVRTGLQYIGFSFPGIIGPICAVVYLFCTDVYAYDKHTVTNSDETIWNPIDSVMPIMGYNDFRLTGSAKDANPWREIILILVFNVSGMISYVSVTTHIWRNKSWPYPLERDVFVLPGFRTIYTTLYSLLNRRIEDLKEVEEKGGAVRPRKSVITGGPHGRPTSVIIGTGGRKTGLWGKGQKAPYIFVCTTLWHEEENEMRTLMTSVAKLLHHARWRYDNPNGEIPYNIEVHIFFDNVFIRKKCENVNRSSEFQEANEWLELNMYVKRFMQVMEKVLSTYKNGKKTMDNGKIVRTPYGGRVEYNVAGYPFFIHLKNATLVLAGKRWSQVMYLYYLIGWKIDACHLEYLPGKRVKKEKAFILALDGDVDFDPAAFELVLGRCQRNDKVAACCGQIHPTGSGYLVAYQNFEYAVGHWLQKTAEHVLGCVLCSPGCFSLMRVSYLANTNVMAMYKSLPQTPMQKLQYDQGEDRWLCTLMLMSGGRIEFEGSSHCNTFAPEDLATFYKQRRRWGPSTTANIWELIRNQKAARKNNPYISSPYILYQLTVLIFSLIGLSTTIMMITEAFSLGVGASLPKWVCYLIILGPVVLFTLACYLSGDGELQLQMATWFSLGFSFIMACVLIGIIIEGVNCPLSPSFLFFMALALINILGGVLHGDFYALICGIIYFLFIPSCFIFLMIYSVSNMNDVSWGTRQGKSENKNEVKKTFWQRLTGKSTEQIEKGKNGISDGTNCTCVICLDSRYEIRIKDEYFESKKVVVVDQPTKPKQELPKEKMAQVVRKSNFFQNKDDSKKRTDQVRPSTTSRGAFLGAGDTSNDFLDNHHIEKNAETYDVNDGDQKTGDTVEQLDIDGEKYDLLKPIKTEGYYGGFQIQTLRTIYEDKWATYMAKPLKNPETCLTGPLAVANDSLLTLRDVRDRELKNYKRCCGTDYLSWIICEDSPFKKRCKVYTLSNPEQKFWETMADPTEGYIGIRNQGRDFKNVLKLQDEIANGLTDFRNEKFMYYIFINILWMIVSLVLLMYSDLLLQIKIDLPPGNPTYNQCGEILDDDTGDDSNTFEYGDDYEDEEPVRTLIIQPFSVFFLFIYIIIIVTQFFCMIWHRISTLWHYIAYINIEAEKEMAKEAEAQQRSRANKKRRNLTKQNSRRESCENDENGSDEDNPDPKKKDGSSSAVKDDAPKSKKNAHKDGQPVAIISAVGLDIEDPYSDEKYLLSSSLDKTSGDTSEKTSITNVSDQSKEILSIHPTKRSTMQKQFAETAPRSVSGHTMIDMKTLSGREESTPLQRDTYAEYSEANHKGLFGSASQKPHMTNTPDMMSFSNVNEIPTNYYKCSPKSGNLIELNKKIDSGFENPSFFDEENQVKEEPVRWKGNDIKEKTQAIFRQQQNAARQKLQCAQRDLRHRFRPPPTSSRRPSVPNQAGSPWPRHSFKPNDRLSVQLPPGDPTQRVSSPVNERPSSLGAGRYSANHVPLQNSENWFDTNLAEYNPAQFSSGSNKIPSRQHTIDYSAADRVTETHERFSIQKPNGHLERSPSYSSSRFSAQQEIGPPSVRLSSHTNDRISYQQNRNSSFAGFSSDTNSRSFSPHATDYAAIRTSSKIEQRISSQQPMDPLFEHRSSDTDKGLSAPASTDIFDGYVPSRETPPESVRQTAEAFSSNLRSVSPTVNGLPHDQYDVFGTNRIVDIGQSDSFQNNDAFS